MPWISAAAARHTLRETSREHLSNQRAGTAPKSVTHMPITNAFIGGEEATMRLAAEQAESLLPWMEERVPLDSARNVANYLNLTVAAHYAGGDVNRRVDHLLKAKTDKDPITTVLRWIAERVRRPDAKAPNVSKGPRWLVELTRRAAADALDQVLVPDHPEFIDMQKFILPLALVLEATTKTPFPVYARDGGHPERRGEVLYERDTYPATRNTDEGLKWDGFDAVETKAEGVFAYFYLNQKWDAPIVFQPDIDAMPFLHDLAGSWQRVEKALAPERLTALRTATAAGGPGVTYVIARDPARAPVAAGALENAATKYSIKLVVADFMTI